MKYLSLLLFLVAMRVSWGFINTPPTVETSVHVGIQNDLRVFIEDYIKKNLPTAREIQFDNFWTETLKSKQIKAHFSYSFVDDTEDDGAARVGINGYAILNKTDKETAEEEFWSFDELYVLDNKIEFKNGVVISPNDPPETE